MRLNNGLGQFQSVVTMKKLSINAKLLISGVTLPDIEVLSMSMRPYLPREFPQTSVTVVSIIK